LQSYDCYSACVKTLQLKINAPAVDNRRNITDNVRRYIFD
jgi:hypothetical protein